MERFLDFYFIDGVWIDSILFFYPLHGAIAVENPLLSHSNLLPFAVIASISLFVTYLLVQKLSSPLS